MSEAQVLQRQYTVVRLVRVGSVLHQCLGMLHTEFIKANEDKEEGNKFRRRYFFRVFLMIFFEFLLVK